MVIKVIDQVNDEELLDSVWRLYSSAFRGINALAVQRHLMYRTEFEEVMRDAKVQKYLCLDDAGRLCGLSTYTNDLFAMPLISPEYFERRWPELYAQRKIWYCGFVAVPLEVRSHSAFAELVEAMYLTAATQNGIISLDFCQFNDDRRKMGRVVSIMLNRLSGECHAERMDQQSFWVYEFPTAA
ncbi:MAG: hypothetical protein QOE51_3371 [Actinoplanes sp.]|jgi:hypothetical protein|nr:hypothetical protein [Actinoplanes sp.]